VIELRPYQAELVDEVRATLGSGRRRVLLQAPTGSGKTVIFAHIAHRVAAKGKRVLILVHRQELVRQTVAKLTEYGVTPDLIVAGTREVARGHVAVASVQTMVRRLHQYPGDPWDLVVQDEAHHAVANSFKRVLDAFRGAYQLGVTATPERLDGRGLAACYDALVVGPGVRDLIRAGHLADFVCYSHPDAPDLSQVGTSMGDYAQDQLSDVMSRPVLMGDAVAHYVTHLAGRPAIAFAVTIRHAEALAGSFVRAGIRAASVDGTLGDDERARRIGGLATGEVQVLTSCELVSEGLDIPAVSGAILCRPTKSLSIYLQQVGRTSRPKEDGGRAVILDHAGNVIRHGLPDATHPWSLTADKRKPDEKSLVKVCKACFAAVPIHCKVCPECGTPFPLAIPKPPPRARAGRLEEVRGWAHVERTRAGVEAATRECRNWQELKGLGKHLGYQKGWAYKKARELGWYEKVNGMGFTTGFQPRERVA
jgi:DNA repair protein RadD